ncbi:MAG: exo-alpha-sialidase [Mariniphaga sp.]
MNKIISKFSAPLFSPVALLCFLTGCFLLLPFVSEAQQKSGSSFRSEFIFPEQDKHVHSSSIVELPNGDLLSCWFEGSGERHANDVMIKGARREKGASQWSEPFVMADTPDHPDCNPVLFLDGKNRLHLVWVVVIGNRWEASLLKTKISTDFQNEGAPVWNWQDIILPNPGELFTGTVEKKLKEIQVPDRAWAEYAPPYEKQIIEAAQDPKKREVGWMTRIQPLTLPSGKILLPLYSDGYNMSLLVMSDDNGDTWKVSEPIVGRGNIQPTLLRKKDGSIVAYMRDSGDAPGRVFKSSSEDNGYSWDPALKIDIPNPGSSLAAISLNNGNWVLVYNNTENGRHRLAVSLSDDEGKTWKWTNYLENEAPDKGGFSYPNVIQTADGMIHVSYSYQLPNEKTIKHAWFNEAWIKETPQNITNAEKLGFPKGKKVLLLHMDDLGMCKEANEAGKYYIGNDYILSGAVMMPCPNAEEFVEWAITQPKADVGVHLTLTSEWKTWRWGTLTDAAKVPGLIDPDGKMWHSVMEVVLNATPEEVEMEIRAQIDKMLAMGYNPTHIDTHMGTLYGSPEFLKVFLKVAEEYKIPANAIDLSNPKVAAFYREAGYPVNEEVIEMLGNYNLPHLDNFGSVPKGKTYDEVKANFFKLVNALDPGLTEIIFHPSVETENLKTITGSWQQRVWEAEMFADPEVIRFFGENEVIITTWREVMERFEKK